MKKNHALLLLLLSALFAGKVTAQISWTIFTASNSILGSDNYKCVEIDQSGNVWVGSAYSGLYKYNGTTWTKFSTSNSNILYNDIYDLLVDNSNKIWAGNYKGVSVFNGSTFTNYDTINASFKGQSVYALGKDNNGKIFLSSRNASFGYKGVTTFDGTTWTNLTGYPSQIANDEFPGFAFNAANVCYMASGNGVVKYTGNVFTFYPKATTGLWSSDCVTMDASGNAWWAGFDGLLKYNGSSWTYFDNVGDLGLTSNTLYYDMLADGNYLWIASSSGFMKFDRVSGTVLARYTATNSPLPTNGVLGIAKAANGDLWLSTIDMVVKTNLASVGITEGAVENNVNVYPNPSAGIFNLSCDQTQAFNYRICTATGGVVLEGKALSKALQVDLSGEAPGIYFAHISSGSAQPQVIKLMKE
jgi:hypothetical protein